MEKEIHNYMENGVQIGDALRREALFCGVLAL